MSLFHAKRLFDDARIHLGALKTDDAPTRAVIYDVTFGLSALSEGLEKECREIKEMLANIHQALTDAKGPQSE